MSYKGVVMFNAAMDKLRQGVQDTQAINMARANLAQKQQQIDIQKKQADLNLETGALKNQQTSLEMQNTQQMMDLYFKNQQQQLDGQNAMIDQQEHQTVTDQRQAHSVAGQLFNTDPDVKNYATSSGAQQNGQPSPMGSPDVASAYANSGAIPGNAAITNGPQGGTIVGQDGSDSQPTPNAIASLFGNLPEVGSMKPTMTGQGKIAMKPVTAADNEGQMLQSLVQAKAKGIPLNADETAFYNKKMGISNNNTQQFNSDVQSAIAGKQNWKDVLSKYPDQAKKLMDIKFAAENMDDGTHSVSSGSSQAPGNSAEDSSMTGQIKIQTADGQIGFIPAANLQEALKRGAMKIDGQ